ncbi:MAG: DUF2339 domain-containing protein, partial [Phycisphaerales bacterium]
MPVAPTIAPPVIGQEPWRPAAAPRSVPAPRAARPPRDLESLIGGRWFMAAGALIVVVGVAMFLKLAHDKGWLTLPPAAKCLIGAAFGAALLGAGEVLRRRLGAKASVGASAAGLAILYGSAFAAYGVYDLIPGGVAFVLLALIAALGFAIAGVANLVSLAVLALVGAYLNPLIIRAQDPSPFVMPVYLLTLQVVGLALSAWRASPFRPLRLLTWWGTVLLGTAWLLAQGRDVPGLGLVFLGAVWVAIHAELALAALASARSAEGEEEWALRSLIDRPITEVRWARIRFMATSFSSTAWVAVMGTGLAHGGLVPDWTVPAALCAATAVLALMLAGNLRILRDVPGTDLERLGAGLMMQAGGLLIAAVALGIGGWMQAVAWLAMGAAAVGAGRWVRSRGLDLYGLVVLSIAAARLATIDSPLLSAPAWSVRQAGLVLSSWTVLMGAGGAAWWAAALLLLRFGEPSRAWRTLAHWAAVVAMALIAGSLLSPGADPLSVAAAWLGLAVATQWVARLLAAPPVMGVGFAILGLATLGIVAGAEPLLAIAGRGAPEPEVYLTLAGLAVTRWMVLMGAAAAAWIASAALVARDRAEGAGTGGPRLTAIPILVGLVLLYGAMLQPSVAPATRALVWAALGAVVVGLHSRRPRLALDLMGVGGLLLAGGAWAWSYPMGWMASGAPALLHPGLWVSLAIAALLVGAGLWLRSSRNPAPLTIPELVLVPIPAAAALLFVSSSLEVARVAGIITSDLMVRRAAVSIWWGLLSVALILGGFLRARPSWRYAGLALMGAAALKAVILDLAEVSALARIISFVALGLLMLGVAAGYTGLARVHSRAAPPAPPA